MASDQWFYLQGRSRVGPLTHGQLVAKLLSGELPPDVTVWRHGFTKWTPADQVQELTASIPPPVEPVSRARAPGSAVSVALSRSLRRWTLAWLAGLAGLGAASLLLRLRFGSGFSRDDAPTAVKALAGIALASLLVTAVGKVGLLVSFARIARKVSQHWILWVVGVLIVPFGAIVACVVGNRWLAHVPGGFGPPAQSPNRFAVFAGLGAVASTAALLLSPLLPIYSWVARESEAVSVPAGLVQAETLMIAQKWTEALAAFREEAVRSPSDARVKNGMGAALIELGLYSQAREQLQSVLVQDPDNGRAHWLIGRSYVDEWFETKKHPCPTDDVAAKGACELEKRQRTPALLLPSVAHLERAVQLNQPRAHLYLGVALQEADIPGIEYAERLKRAVQTLREAVRLEPESDAANRELGSALLRELVLDTSRVAGAERESQELVRLRREEAFLLLRRATALNPKGPGNWVKYCFALADEGRFTEARMENDVAARYIPAEAVGLCRNYVHLMEVSRDRERATK